MRFLRRLLCAIIGRKWPVLWCGPKSTLPHTHHGIQVTQGGIDEDVDAAIKRMRTDHPTDAILSNTKRDI